MTELTIENVEKIDEKRVLYIDEYLAVFNKYCGDICESWKKGVKEPKDTFVPDIFKLCSSETSFKFCQCFNRLDRPVSGANVLVFNDKMFSLLQNQFTNSQGAKKTVTKTYWAIVEGQVEENIDFTHLVHYLRFDATKQKAFVSDTEQRKSKKAELLYRCVGKGTNYSFLEIQLLTGRTHQIRAQLARVGLHIKGDSKYGARRQERIGGIRLHARSISFVHPKTHKEIFVKAPLALVDPLWQAFLDIKGEVNG